MRALAGCQPPWASGGQSSGHARPTITLSYGHSKRRPYVREKGYRHVSARTSLRLCQSPFSYGNTFLRSVPSALTRYTALASAYSNSSSDSQANAPLLSISAFAATVFVI